MTIKKNNKTTGHEWDGIKELTNPIPRLWAFAFGFLIVISIVIWFFLPSWPTLQNYFKGFGDFSQVESDEILTEIAGRKYSTMLEKASFEEILAQKDLRNFATALGKNSFLLNCSGCHGIGGSGNKNFPVLKDKNWIWGGDLADIYTTIKYGIRNSDIDSRQGDMQAFVGTDVLTKEEAELVTYYTRSFSDNSVNLSQDEIKVATNLFSKNCASCHGENALGDVIQGVPNLRDNTWLYGDSHEDIYHSIAYGRAGVMPVWRKKLHDSTIKATAIYVYSLSHDLEKEEAISTE